jgi:hypothetical protein
MSLRQTWYLHTVMGGRPAFFDETDQTVYLANRSNPAVLVPTLAHLRSQQQKSIRSRRADGFTEDNLNDYGYVRVVLPTAARAGGSGQ